MLRRLITNSIKTGNIFKTQFKFAIFSIPPIKFYFSTNNINNHAQNEKIEKLKKQSQYISTNYIGNIYQLRSSADFQPVLIRTKEPIILDLYADWCEPCKKLTPRLQDKIKSTQNIKMLKINIDTCPEIAQALQVKAVPTIYLIYQGEPIQRLQGNVDETQFNKLFQTINKLTELNKQYEKAVQILQIAKTLIGQKKLDEAVQVLQKFNQKNVSLDLIAIKQLLLTQCYIGLGKPSKFNDSMTRASKFEQFYKQAPVLQQFYLILKQQISKFQQLSQEDPQLSSLQDKLSKADNKDTKLSAQFDLVNYYKNKQMIQNALQLAMEIIKQDKQWEDKKTNKLVLSIFKQLGNNSPIVQKYRKILQRVIS